jgi:hypothetical protein
LAASSPFETKEELGYGHYRQLNVSMVFLWQEIVQRRSCLSAESGVEFRFWCYAEKQRERENHDNNNKTLCVGNNDAIGKRDLTGYYDSVRERVYLKHRIARVA